MKNQLLIIMILICILSDSVKAEVKQVLDDFPPITVVDSWRPRNIHGVFEFVELPEPLKVATINYRLEITGLYPNSSELDFTIKLPTSDRFITILSDSLVTWNAPHKVGDIYTGTIEFIPLSSGKHSINLSVVEILQDFTIEWLFDEERNLLALDNLYIDISDYDFLNTYFFNNDSIFIFNNKENNKAFQHELTIKPIPKIGDTSTVHVRLKANRNFPNGIDLELTGGRVNIVKNPDFVDYSIIKNQRIDLYFQIVPDSFNFRHGIGLNVYNDISNKLDSKNNFDIGISLLFNEDGTLRYVLDQAFGMKKVKEYYLNNFKSPIGVVPKTVKLLKDGTILKKE